MSWKFFFKRFVPAAAGAAVVWIWRREIENMVSGNGS